MDKKNTLLLTVIAIATLLVAVVGATFAYFSAQTGAGANASINVTTSTTDTATFEGFEDIVIDANQQNFATGKGSLMGSAEGKVTFTSSDASAGSKEYCYNVNISIEENSFIYSLPKTFGSSKNWPELILNIWKEGNSTEEEIPDIEATGNHYEKSFAIISDSNKLEYVDNILASTKVCKCESGVCDDSSCEDAQKIAGYDLTVVGNGKANYVINDGEKYYVDTEDQNKVKKVEGNLEASTETNTNQDMKTIAIPVYATEYSDFSSTKFEHKITAQEAGNTVHDYWKFSVTLVNYTDNDSNGAEGNLTSGDQNLNTNRRFKAKISFVPKTTCENN